MKPFYLDGRRIESPLVRPVLNPWSGENVADVCIARGSDVEEAVASAHRAFASTRKMAAGARSATLDRIAGLILARREELAGVIVAEAGKPIAYAEAEVDRAVQTFRFAAAHALADGGHGIAMDASAPGEGHFGYVRRFPIGVVLGITPFNFPLNLVAHKVAPCLATGNAMLLKPAMKTPLTALLLSEVLEEAGVPAGQVNILPFEHEFVPRLLSDARVKMLSFTGGVEVGWKLKAQAARLKVVLELGGNAAVIVEPDSDWKSAMPLIAVAAFGFAGQSCISVQRILVHQEIIDDFRQALVDYTVHRIRSGNPLLRETMVGPMINTSARQRVLDWIEEATGAGAELLTPIHLEGISLLRPVILEWVPSGCSILDSEAFASVAVLQEYKTYNEALRLANSSRFGLHAGVFTNNFSKALQAHEEIDAGGIMINQVPTYRVENMPYGGVKDSGSCREGVAYAMEEMTEPRSLVIKRC